MQVDKNLREKMLFIKKFVTEPRTIGSVTPSSTQLVDSMLCNIDWGRVESIAELGAGTGVMTKAIMKRKSKGSRLFVFEIEEDLRRMLRYDTGLEIYDDARFLPGVLDNNGLSKVDLIVSSLPYAVLPHGVTEAVLRGVSASLAEDGRFVAFQYSLHMKSSFEKLFKEVKTRFVMMNIPPAFVYECRGIRK
ncbi:MAG: methyltransferase type 11 [Synergistaceae bacterium]|nr:methyltransferase type 11 [Synergistaceae bacterium]